MCVALDYGAEEQSTESPEGATTLGSIMRKCYKEVGQDGAEYRGYT